jgi:hypothetical protein
MKLITPPEVGIVYYIPGYFKPVDKVVWANDIVDNNLLKLGKCFTTPEEVEPSVITKRDR